MHLRAVWTPCCRQIDQLSETSLEWSQWVEGISQVWDLIKALWSRLEICAGEETVETHKVTMAVALGFDYLIIYVYIFSV